MFGFLKKIKKRRILVISAGGLQGGLQCCYISTINGSWEIIAHSFVPYPKKIASFLQNYAMNKPVQLTPSSMAWLDYKLSLLYTECARTTLAQLPTAQRKPHCAVVNKPCLWKGPTGEEQQQTSWDIPLGDVQHLSSTFKIPVLTDLIRHNCIAGGQGVLPTHFGNVRIASLCGGIVIFINIGLISRMTIVDTQKSEVLVDSDTGPGTCCINLLVQQFKSESEHEGFDRDGALAGQGTVSGDCLEYLSQSSWFNKPAPKEATPQQFEELIKDPTVTQLSYASQLTSITALTARTIYHFYRKEFKRHSEQQTVFLSGGGSNNQTLLTFLKTYFDSIPFESIEKLGIPVDMRISLALGLTVNGYVGGIPIPWESGVNPETKPLGRWVLP